VSARLPVAAHTSLPWRIGEIAPDFRVLDVWALPTPGGKDDFPRLVELFETLDLTRGSAIVRALFAIRMKVGGLLGLDRAPGDRATGFTPLYRGDDEWALEIVNQTVHGILHVGWVKEGDGYRGQLAVLVKPNGRFGAAYLAAIAPFRHRLVYPAMLRQIEDAWHSPVP
jgi:uncharacterized protein DUF2867